MSHLAGGSMNNCEMMNLMTNMREELMRKKAAM
jgi:hypothetical protein